MSRLPLLALGLLLTFYLAVGSTARAADEHAAGPASGHAPAGDGHAAEGGDPNILEVQPSLAIWTVVVFIILLLVLRATAWKPLIDALHRREDYMSKALDDAERARQEGERLLADHKAQLAQTAGQVRAMLEEARRDAESTSNEIVRKAQEEAESSRKRAEREIANARDQALVEVWNQAADLAVSVAGKVLGRTLDEGDHRRLIEVATAELPEAPTVNGKGAQG